MLDPKLDPNQLPEPIWVVAPHPDDEALGCGGLLAALSDLGGEVHALLVTDGGASHPHSVKYPRPALVGQRLTEWRAGLLELGIPAGQTVALGFPDGELARSDPARVRSALARAWATAPPATLLLPWRRDPHPDHRACWVCFEPLLGRVPCVLEYTVWLPERGEPGDWPQPAEGLSELLFPLSAAQQQRKANAIAAHRSQLGLIDDDPSGFVLAPEMVQRAVAGPERFFRHFAGRAGL
ncbi:PIG-L deacetylase family protein [Deinococcus sp.]|uniref:PIG-L deacetylase family protein n=1 Tax=Deinococcus sp. TaxID=47478 RepID=UPI0025BBF4EE|nr:PIG-L deacetylase family protein [Deinococcus sp.]